MIDMYNGTYNANSKPTIFSKEFLTDIKVPVEASLGKKDMSISEILGIGEGTIIELNKFAGSLLILKSIERKWRKVKLL